MSLHFNYLLFICLICNNDVCCQVFSQQTTQTLYSVETVTESLASAVQKTPELEDLLARFLSLSSPAPGLPQPSRQQYEVTSTEVTETITHSSTYVTQVGQTFKIYLDISDDILRRSKT